MSIVRARSIHGGGFVAVQDPTGATISYTKLLLGSLALGTPLAELTRRGEHVGVLLPNVNAAIIAFFALQAFGRVPAMLNFSAGIGNMQAGLVAAGIGTVITSRAFVEKAKLERRSKRWRSRRASSGWRISPRRSASPPS